MTAQTVKIQIPSAFQDLLVYPSPYLYLVYYGGRGGAKSHTVARALLLRCIQRKTRVMCVREVMQSISTSVHRLLADLIYAHGLSELFEVQRDRILGPNGSEFIFKGLRSDPAEIKSTEGIDICWVEEAATVSEESWELLGPTIRKDNSVTVVTFNTRFATDPTYKRFVAEDNPKVLCKKVSYLDNPFHNDKTEAERLMCLEKNPEAYDHIWGGAVDTRKAGYIFARQMEKMREEKRITAVPYDPEWEVFAGADLGWTNATVIWWAQFVGRELRVIDYCEVSETFIPELARMYKNKPYNYRKVSLFLPHDGDAGNVRGDSVATQFRKAGVPCITLPREQSVGTGINTAKLALEHCVIDKERCRLGISALDAYRSVWNEHRMQFSDTPFHDWASDGADAFRTLARAAMIVKGGLATGEAMPVAAGRARDRHASSNSLYTGPRRGVYRGGGWMGT